MIKKKKGSDQAIDGKQPIQGQDYRQTCTRGISSLTPSLFGNFIESRDEWDSLLPRRRKANVVQALAKENR